MAINPQSYRIVCNNNFTSSAMYKSLSSFIRLLTDNQRHIKIFNPIIYQFFPFINHIGVYRWGIFR